MFLCRTVYDQGHLFVLTVVKLIAAKAGKKPFFCLSQTVTIADPFLQKQNAFGQYCAHKEGNEGHLLMLPNWLLSHLE